MATKKTSKKLVPIKDRYPAKSKKELTPIKDRYPKVDKNSLSSIRDKSSTGVNKDMLKTIKTKTSETTRNALSTRGARKEQTERRKKTH